MNNPGVLYFQGRGVKKDTKAAKGRWEKAP